MMDRSTGAILKPPSTSKLHPTTPSHIPTPHTPHPNHQHLGKTGEFENPETRDIARNVPEIMAALGDLRGKVVADVGAGTGGWRRLD